MKADTPLTGYIYPLFVGLYGIFFFLIYCFMVDIGSLGFRATDYLMILGGGLCETVGMVLQILASSIGIGGIAFSLANTCCIFVTLFNYLVFSQPITFLQVIGIGLAILGATTIALEDRIYAILAKLRRHPPS